VTVGEASEATPEDTVDVADFWAPGLNDDVLKPNGRYARFIVHGVEASPSLTAYVRKSPPYFQCRELRDLLTCMHIFTKVLPWGPPVIDTMQAWQRGLVVLRYLPPTGIDRAFVDVQARLRRQHDADHQFHFPFAEHPSFLFQRILVYKRHGDKFGRGGSTRIA